VFDRAMGHRGPRQKVSGRAAIVTTSRGREATCARISRERGHRSTTTPAPVSARRRGSRANGEDRRMEVTAVSATWSAVISSLHGFLHGPVR
jgi:hypothetical protein